MNRRLFVLRTPRVLAIGLALTIASAAVASDMGQVAVDQVTEAGYRYFLGDSLGVEGILYTHDGDGRDIGDPQHDLARANIVAEFESYGLTVELHPFTYSSTTYYNVIATKVGTLYPDQQWVIGSHFDSTTWYGPAPGADDDASGVATVLETARIVSQYDSDYTIKFMCFDREEQGLIGSTAYVGDHNGDDILGMVQCDMMAWDPDTNTASIWSHSFSAPLKNALLAAIAEYSEYLGVSLTGIDRGWNGQSDHRPFDTAGYQALMFIEGEGFNNSTIHTSNDSVDNPGYINYPFAVRMTKSVVGWVVDAAGVQVDVNGLGFSFPDDRPETVNPTGGTTMRVEVYGMGDVVPQPATGLLHYDVGLGWMSTPMVEVEPNVYDAVFPSSQCGDTISYYVSAAAVGSELFTAPRTAPAASFTATSTYGTAAFFEDTFDSDPGWTTQGQWAFGQPTGGGGQYGGPDPLSGYTGNNVYGYNLNGDYGNGLAEQHLTSTAIDCTGLTDVSLEFWRWLGVEQPTYDHAYVRVSNNGTNWVTVWENTAAVEDTSWTPQEFDISTIADDQPTVYLRWTMGTTDGSWQYCGWNIDDVVLTAVDCQAPFAPGDMDCDGDVDFDDIDPFVLALSGQSGYEAAYPECIWLNADTDGDGTVSFDDIDPFVALLGG